MYGKPKYVVKKKNQINLLDDNLELEKESKG